MTPFIRAMLRKIGRPRLVISLIVIASLLSILIKYLLEEFFGFSFIFFEELIFIFTASSIIAPLLSWYLLGLLFELDKLERQSTKLATIDALTNTYNRGHFYHQSNAYIKYFFAQPKGDTNNQQDTKLAVMILDLDDFKSINDIFGHSVGDEALVAFSSVIMASVQASYPTNIQANNQSHPPMPNNIVGRFGGDEFAALIVGTTEEKLKHLLDGLIINICKHRVPNKGRPFSLTASIGAAFIGNKRGALDDALIKADDALYEVKRKGKAGYVIYGSSLLT